MPKKLISCKKGESEMWAPDTMPFWIVFAIVLGFTAVFFAIVMISFGSAMLKVPEDFEGYILTQRFFGGCFLLNKEGIKPDVTDYSKFTQDRLNYCYNPEETYAFMVSLKGQDLATNQIKTSNWLEGGKIIRKNVFAVKVSKDDKILNGVMEIEIQKNR